MKASKTEKIIVLVLVCALLFSAPSYAQEITLLQKLKYREEYIMDTNGREFAVLVGRLSNKVDYLWAVNKWIEPPLHIQHCYENQRMIRSHVRKRYRHRRTR